MASSDSSTPHWAGGLERLGRDGIDRVLEKAGAEGLDAAMGEALARDPDLVRLFRVTGRADWRFLIPEHDHQRAVVLGSGLGGTAFDLSEDYAEVVSCERSPEALAWQGCVASSGSFPNVRIVAAESEPSPLPDGCADLVALESGLAQFPVTRHGEDPGRMAEVMVREARRLLKDGGWLYWGLENRRGFKLPRRRDGDGAGFQFTPSEIRKVLEREGMSEVALYWVLPDLLTQSLSGWMGDSRTFKEFVRMRRVENVNEAIRTFGLTFLGWTNTYRQIVPYVLVFARRGATGRDRVTPGRAAPPQPAFVRDVEHLLADQGRPVEGLQAMLVQSNHNLRGRLTYCLFERGRSRPGYVVKLARNRRSREVVTDEARAFRSLTVRSEFVRGQRPRTYHLGEETTFVLEGFVVGRTLSTLRGGPVYEARALDWLEAFQSAAAGGPLRRIDLEERLRRLAAATESEPFRKLANDTARKVMAVLDFEVAEVPIHGDFTSSNILLDGNELYVIDWEWLRLGGWPLEDLWWYLMVTTRDAPGAGVETGADRMVDALTGRGAYASRVRDLARGFARARRVPSILVPVFAIVTLLEMTLRWKDERRVDWQTAPTAEYEAALRGLLLRQNEFWEFWGQDDDTVD